MLTLLFFLILLMVLIALPYSVRFVISFWSSIFQLYTFSVFGFYPSISLLASASLAPTLISLRRSFLQPPVICLLGLFALQIISLIYSPDRHFGAHTILYEIPFLIMYLVAFNLAQKNLDQFLFYIKVYAALSLLPLLFLFAFAFNPQLNLLYIKSILAHFFNHHDSIQWYLTGYLEDTWQGKPRGIIFDPNAAGGYFGICALIFYGVGVYCHSVWLKCIAVLHWVGIFFTSVVAAMCLGVAFPLFVIFVYLYREKKSIYGIPFRPLSFCLIGLLLLSTTLVLLKHEQYINFFITKIASRLTLWKLALVPLLHHPLKGLGFGGLEHIYANLYPPLIDKPLYRPHNTLIAIWAQSGIVAALLALGFIISVLFSCWRAFIAAADKNQRLFTLLISSAILWMFLHAMGENWGIVSEVHTQSLIAVAYGLIMGLHYRSTKKIWVT